MATYVKVNGTWRHAPAYYRQVKVNGVFRTAPIQYVKVNGTWRRVD